MEWPNTGPAAGSLSTMAEQSGAEQGGGLFGRTDESIDD